MKRTRSIEESRRRLLRWYRRVRRDLPWRRTRDPYAIWLSEVMLQQTTVAAVVPYYERFLGRFPDVGVLARARLDTVLAAWSGLGYYRRARNLHAAAKIVAREGFPAGAAGWRALPGVGVYTAAAIASIVHGEPISAVDGNVERVLSRMHRIRRDPGRIKELAQAWISPRAPGNHNQAVMELGATVCTPRRPRCDECPVRTSCSGRDSPGRYPVPRARPKPIHEHRAVAFVLRGECVKLVRNKEAGRLGGMWDLPEADPAGQPLATVRHTILDRRWTLSIHEGRTRRRGSWFDARHAAALPLTGAARKCLKRVGFLVG